MTIRAVIFDIYSALYDTSSRRGFEPLTCGVARVQWVSPYEVCRDVADRGGCRGCYASEDS
jgi:FMN phosphatase YigB (HAD superfamily)